MDLATTVFNSRRMVNRTWIFDPYKKRTGLWTHGISYHDFLVVETVEVQMNHRRKGVGKAMMQAIFKLAEERGAEHVYYWPTHLNTAPDYGKLESPAIFSANKSRAIAFCTSVGFRRIGSSRWFGYAIDLADQSRRLPAVEDFVPDDEPALNPSVLPTDLAVIEEERKAHGNKLLEWAHEYAKEHPELF